VTEEEPLRELLLPRNAATRLCFFSLPLELLSFYRERVFPVVEEAGFVPVTADEVVTPGDNFSAKIDALIDRAAVMVIELTSSWTMAEYRMAVARIKGAEADSVRYKPFRIIIVVTDLEQIPLSAQGFPVLRRPNTITDDPEGFIAELGSMLRGIADETGVARQAEPQRLFEAKEYRAAVISAMTLLEATLRERLNKVTWQVARRPLSMRSLLDQAVEQGVVPPESKTRVSSWMRLRNEVVHSAMPVSKAQASEIVNGVVELSAPA
jgi:uncharacterized protein YutE (UPF0331/DUF86 family)